ncbi:MAG: hypothetical protein JJU11_01575 [Candidatus Sumerlaeia bacterium]|nr:hypothetical protein [Candidatus Sumerlaeia bacterium]
MPHRRSLTQEEETRCLQFLEQLGINEPGHRVLADRGFFGLFLSGLTPDDVPGKGVPMERKEIQETIRLLAIAGVDNIRDLLARKAVPVPTKSTDSSSPDPQPKVQPPKGDVEPIRNFRNHKTSEIVAHRPTEEEREILRHLEHPSTAEDAIATGQRHLQQGRFHEAYHVLVDYILHHEVSEQVLREATHVIFAASEFDRSAGKSPENMLYECEEMAAILSRRIPEMSRLRDIKNRDLTEKIYRIVKLLYKTWALHCRALLEYRYMAADGNLMRRNWIDPRDFGFLVEMMRMGVRSRLPLDLLNFIYIETRKCVEIGAEVIAHDDKRAKFRGDVLRIIASPTRDVIPDMTFAIFKDIVNAYLDENDTESALIFCKQALMIRQHDSEMLTLKRKLEELGASRLRAGGLRKIAGNPGSGKDGGNQRR